MLLPGSVRYAVLPKRRLLVQGKQQGGVCVLAYAENSESAAAALNFKVPAVETSALLGGVRSRDSCLARVDLELCSIASTTTCLRRAAKTLQALSMYHAAHIKI